MSEYSKYSIDEIVEMTLTDDADAMDELGTGWANTALVLGDIREALAARLEAVRKKWTSASASAYAVLVHDVLAQLDVAKTQAEGRAEAVGKIASTARWAKDRVKEAHDAYVQGSPKLDSMDGLTGSNKQASDGQTSAGTPLGSVFSKAFDEKAHKIMKVAVDEYSDQKSAVVAEVHPVRAVRLPSGSHWSDGEDSWAGDGGSGSNTYDMAGLSATSYGGNAVGSHPELQSGPTHMSTTPTHTSPTAPHPTGIPSPTQTGVPLGGVPPLNGGGKPPTAPPKLPTTPVTNARNTLGPRGPMPAPRTPGLPARTTAPIRPAPTTNRWAGRGLQKSQMAPVNRVGEPRKSGEVLGRRTAPAKSTATTQAAPRRVQPSVIRGANKPGTKSSGKSPIDNTNRGYTSRVINPRDRIAEAKGHSRTPLVGDKMKHPAKPEPFGKRPEPETARSLLRHEINEAREKRRKLLKQSDGLSRPVIDNGLSNSAQIDHAIPTPREAVKSEDGFWQPPKDMVPGVIGKRTWDPNTITHDPGPVANARLQAVAAFEAELDQRVKAIDPGPKAFDAKRTYPDTSTWPGA